MMRKEKIPTIKNGIKDVTSWLDAKEKEHTYKAMLGAKAPQRTEIEVSFFQKCNLRCAFCWQDHDDETGVDDIPGKASIVIKYLEEWKDLKEEVVVTMTGGELFQDNVYYYEQYYQFMSIIRDFMPSVKFTMITNLQFNMETLDHVDTLLRRCKQNGIKASLGTSWDVSGRVLNQRFGAVLEYFREDIEGITMVLTKPAIRMFLNDTYDKEFDYLYENYNIDFDYYVPTELSDKMMPSDWELLNVFRFFIKKYPKLPTVRSWLESDFNTLTCGNMNKITILPDNSIVPCRQLDYCESDFKTKINPNHNADMVESYMEKYNCLGCEYFSKCTMTCFVMNDHVSYKEELDDCLYRKMFKEIDGSNN
jgi:MoaA/NifB/PqqE/SkfB family radical SAM enzyme